MVAPDRQTARVMPVPGLVVSAASDTIRSVLERRQVPQVFSQLAAGCRQKSGNNQ